MKILKTKAGRDAVVALILAFALFGVFLLVDLHDAINDFLVRYEDWEFDEIFLALMLLGMIGFVYGYRRYRDLRQEMNERGQAEQRAAWYAFHDPLTRLLNRHYVDEHLIGQSGIAPEDMPPSIFAIDLDDFKGINDLLGHHGGDELLSNIAYRLRDLFPKDEIIRIGGDEFVVLSQLPFGNEARQGAIEAVRTLGRPMAIGGTQVKVGASIGICDPHANAANMAEALHCADLAMYAAKRQGRNSVRVFEPWMREELNKRVALQHALRDAVRDEIIVPHYQPLIWLSTGKVHSFEALARWTDKEGVSIPPSTFIEVAEESGLISELANSLLRRACLDGLSWPAETRLAFNISPRQLSDRLLAMRILRILEETGFPPHRLDVEITESAFVQDLAVAGRVFDELRNAGVQLVLDDFGTGYSSLSQLSNMPFDQIKIDGSFISTFQEDDKQMKVVRAIMGLGHGLGVISTAEGIEQPSQLASLRVLGCDLGQGYLFGRPMPASEIERYLST